MTPSSLRRLALAVLVLALLVGAFFVLRPGGPVARPPAPPATAQSASTVVPPSVPAPVAPVASVKAALAGADDPADFRPALDVARALRDPARRATEFGSLLRRWLARDANAALGYVRGLPAGADRTQAVVLLLEVTAEQDAGRALALARELVRNRDEAAIYSPLFARLGQTDPAAAAARLAEVAPGPGREFAVRALTDAWMRRDGTAALAWAGQLPATERGFALENAAVALSVDDPLRAIELAQKNLNGPALDRTLTRALHRLTELDTPAAASIVALLPAGDTQMLAAVDVARAFAAQNMAGALAWIGSLPAGRTQQMALNNALTVWAAQDAVAAGNYVRRMTPGPLQHATAVELAATLAGANVTAAIDWAQSLPAAETRPAALARIADAWAQRDPAAAARWVAEQARGSGTVPPQALGYALTYWVLKDPGAAQDFVRTLSVELQPGAAASAAPLLAQSNPGAALTWAQSLPVPAARDAAIVAAFARWLDNAPEAARAWLATASLPEEMKAKLRKSP